MRQRRVRDLRPDGALVDSAIDDDGFGQLVREDLEWREKNAGHIEPSPTDPDYKAPPEKRKPPAPVSMRPKIEVRTEEHLVVAEAIDALAIGAPIFARGGMLVHIIKETDKPHGIDRPPNAPRIAPLPIPRLRELMTEVADWIKIRQGKEGPYEVPTHPPSWAVQEVSARGDWPGMLPLEGILEVPILRSDGTIHDARGYDSVTGYCYIPTDHIATVSTNPALADAQAARDLLLDVLVDFPFAADTHRAAAIAMMLTPFARPAFSGPAPLGLIDSNVRGAGKGMLADVIAMVYSGRQIARTALPNSDEEMRKRITALALAGDPVVLIDNVAAVLGFPSLDSALTATTWSDRILGQSANTPTLPLRATWLATGNNVALGADIVRRVMHIRIESHEERPEERTDYRHPNILDYVRERRSELACAALTILRAYCVAGRPPICKRLGSFEGWSDLVRSAVVWCGLPDPDATRQALAENADTEKNAIKTIIEGIENLPEKGYTAAKLIQVCANGNDHSALREAIGDLCPTVDGKPPSAKSLGKKLQHVKRRVVDGKYIDVMNPTQSPIHWVVKQVKIGE